jgi:hypothetical protein
MKKKVLISIVLIVAMGLASYLIVDHFRVHVPQLEQGFGIWESEMEFVANPGGNNTATLTIINGKDQDRLFYVTLEQPRLDKLQAGYEAFPIANYGWFTVPKSAINLTAGQYYRVQIPIVVPINTTYMNRNAELRVRVSAFDTTGLIQLAVESRWYIVVTEEH